MNFNVEWCKDEEQRCDTCPLATLQETDPGVAEHTLSLLGMFEPRDVVKAIHDAEQYYDSHQFGMLVEHSGGDIQTFNGNESGYDLAKAAILKIAATHNLSR